MNKRDGVGLEERLIDRLAGVIIWTGDLDRLSSFYRCALGLEPHSVRPDFVAFRWGGVRFSIGLHSEVEGRTTEPNRVMVNFEVRDVHGAYEALRAKGVEFVRPPEREHWGGWVCTFSDPDGNILQLLQQPSSGPYRPAAPSGRESTMLTPDIPRAAMVAEAITEDFYDGSLDLSARGVATGGTWSTMPEVECVARLRDMGASDRAVRLFLTFIAAMDRARDAVRLWNSGVELFQSYPQTFDPAEASAIPIDTLRRRLSRYGVSQRHDQDSRAWRVIAGSLAEGGNPISRVVDSGIGNAGELLRHRRTYSGGKPRFPLLRGPKIGPMWVRMLVAPGGASIEDVDTIPVAVDVQVRRVTANLGVSDAREAPAEVIQNAWLAAVARTRTVGPPGLAGTCAGLDPALWTFGKYGCSHCEKVARPAPIGRACDHCRLWAST